MVASFSVVPLFLHAMYDHDDDVTLMISLAPGGQLSTDRCGCRWPWGKHRAGDSAGPPRHSSVRDALQHLPAAPRCPHTSGQPLRIRFSISFGAWFHAADAQGRRWKFRYPGIRCEYPRLRASCGNAGARVGGLPGFS
jgi:hypothetical protein